MINFKDEDEPQNETVRQTIERVARELGVFGTTPTNNIAHSPQSSPQQPTALGSSPNYSATAANNWQIQPATSVPQNSNTFGNASQSNQPTGLAPSPIQQPSQTPSVTTNHPGQPSPAMQAIYRYLNNIYGYQNPQIPPAQMQTPPAVQQPETQTQSAEQVPAWQQPIYVSENMYAWQKQKQLTPVIYHNQQNTSSPGQIDYAKWGENIINNQKVPSGKMQSTNYNNEYNIRDDKNYAWAVPEPYDRGGNIRSVYNNFLKINQEHPIANPISTGNNITDAVVMKFIAQYMPYAALALNAYKYGYMGEGYYDNLTRAYHESYRNKRVFSDEELLSLQNK